MKMAIVDDEQQWIELAKKQVMDYWKQDVDIFTYPSGKTFLDAKEEFDLILMDIEIPLKKIVYFEVVLRAVKLHTDTEEYTCMEQISKLEKQLKQDGFFMPHRSCLLNFQWVQSFTNNEIIMKNGDKLSLSRRKYKEWKIAYFEWKFDRANG